MSLHDGVAEYIDQAWDGLMPVLTEYVSIPNVSESFDPAWKANGHMDRAVALLRDWCASRHIDGALVEVHEIEGRSPVILVDVPAYGNGTNDDTVLLYGHLDKQPEMEGWRDGLGPWTPVVEGDKLYGRGGADDGYAVFSCLTAIEAVRAHGGSHQRLVVLIEASEESGSIDLPAHIDKLASRIGSPSLVVTLDSGCLDDKRLWVTTSLRGAVIANVRVDIVDVGLHSGGASGMVPSTFRVWRQLIDRIENSATGEVLLSTTQVDIPDDRQAEAALTAAEVGVLSDEYPFVDDALPVTGHAVEQLLATSWWPTLCVTGADGLPPTGRAGNVLRPYTSLRLSLRLPPTADPDAVEAELLQVLTTDVPYNARVTIESSGGAPGWNAPPTADWLATALDDASNEAFGKPSLSVGEGGTIPFMGMLGEMFPDAQFVITGVLLPDSNAHGPNEYLHLPTARRVTHAVASVLDAHARRPTG